MSEISCEVHQSLSSKHSETNIQHQHPSQCDQRYPCNAQECDPSCDQEEQIHSEVSSPCHKSSCDSHETRSPCDHNQEEFLCDQRDQKSPCDLNEQESCCVHQDEKSSSDHYDHEVNFDYHHQSFCDHQDQISPCDFHEQMYPCDQRKGYKSTLKGFSKWVGYKFYSKMLFTDQK